MALEITAGKITTASRIWKCNPFKQIEGLWAGSKELAGKTLYLCLGSRQFISMPEGNKITPQTARVTVLGFSIDMLHNVEFEGGKRLDSPAAISLAAALDNALPRPTMRPIWRIEFSQDASAVRDFFRIVCRSELFFNKAVITGCKIEFMHDERLSPPKKMLVFAD
ncbi:MAG: hypothetical protein WC632_01150 [Candidatus Margulisiibacteriota bacterium]